MKQPLPTIDDVLRPFFDQHLEGTAGVKRLRIQQTEALLRVYLETESSGFLIPPEIALLKAERQFDPTAAVCRIMNAETLLFSLLRFIQPPQLQADPLLQRVQLRLVESLIARLVTTHLVEGDTACFQWTLRRALDHAKSELNRIRAEKILAQKTAKTRAFHEQWKAIQANRESTP